MSQVIEIKVPDIGDFKNIPVIEVLVKPGDLPIEQPLNRSVVNPKAAESIGLKLPQSILLQADQVIQ